MARHTIEVTTIDHYIHPDTQVSITRAASGGWGVWSGGRLLAVKQSLRDAKTSTGFPRGWRHRPLAGTASFKLV